MLTQKCNNRSGTKNQLLKLTGAQKLHISAKPEKNSCIFEQNFQYMLI